MRNCQHPEKSVTSTLRRYYYACDGCSGSIHYGTRRMENKHGTQSGIPRHTIWFFKKILWSSKWIFWKSPTIIRVIFRVIYFGFFISVKNIRSAYWKYKKQKKIRCSQRFLPKPHKHWIFLNSGLDGSRTRVQKPIPCPSTSVVCYLTFPPPHENKHPCGFSSFMIRPQVQSLACVVSHIVEAWVLKCECSRSDCCH